MQQSPRDFYERTFWISRLSDNIKSIDLADEKFVKNITLIKFFKRKILIGFRKNIDSYSTRVQKYLFFSHNLHILTLESGTVEINLAILGIDFCVLFFIFKSLRVHLVNTFMFQLVWSLGVNLFLNTSRIEYALYWHAYE